MKVTYNGPEPEIEVVRLGQTWLVKSGEAVDVPDEVAEGLKGQDAWTVSASKTTGREATTTKDGDK